MSNPAPEPMKIFQYIAIISLAGLALCGCTVGPNYKKPEAKLEKSYGELGTNADASTRTNALTQIKPVADWWTTFHDPELNHLIGEAIRKNYDLQIATARIRQSRYQRSISAADLFPEVNADAGYSHARGSKNVVLPLGSASGSSGSTPMTPKAAPQAVQNSGSGTSSSGSGSSTSSSGSPEPLSPFGEGGLPGETTDLYQIGFDASWELDVFGGTRRKLQAATAELQSAVEYRRNVIVTLLAEVARNYLELRGAQERLAVARENLAAQTELLELTQSQRKAGLTDDLNVTRAAGQAAVTRSTIPPLESSVRRSIHSLSTLVAESPTALSAELETNAPLPAMPPEVPVGLPSELLRQRPDIRRAEREVASASALVGSAKADLFPKFYLTGNVGLDSSSLSQLFNWESRYFMISPTVSWPIFDAGKIISNIALQKANQQEAVLDYRNTILKAVQEVEDSLVTYTGDQTRRDALLEAYKQYRIATRLARDQYNRGIVDFLNVLNAQKNELAAQDEKVQSDEAAAVDLVALYKALGGGWQAVDKPTQKKP
jgi:multidrug efflux system outer membrane protein